MADFDNLLDDIEATQPSPATSVHGEPAEYNATTQGTEEMDDNIDGGYDDETAEIPEVLQRALRIQANQNQNDDGRASDDEHSAYQSDDDGGSHTNSEFENLKELWIRELNSTELCPLDVELLDDFIEQLSMQEDVIEDLLEQGRSNGSVDPTLASIAASICKMDMDRLAFVVTDLMRVRLEKIEKYALHNRDYIDRMSKDEIEYLKSYGQLFQNHMERSVTNHLQKGLWKQLDAPEMIDRPNLDTYVFCNVLDDDGVVVNNYLGLNLSEEAQEEGGGRQQHFAKDSHIFVRYRVIRDLITEGKVELLM